MRSEAPVEGWEDRGETGARIVDLAGCVHAFHERFGITGAASREELLSRIPIQDEEVRELQAAILGESDERVASEAADVLFVAIGTVLSLAPALAAEAIREVIEKNDAKTRATHHVNDAGKIVRRSPR